MPGTDEGYASLAVRSEPIPPVGRGFSAVLALLDKGVRVRGWLDTAAYGRHDSILTQAGNTTDYMHGVVDIEQSTPHGSSGDGSLLSPGSTGASQRQSIDAQTQQGILCSTVTSKT